MSKSYGGVSAVDGVSLDLARGEFVTLLGDSGCGKTTLLRILAGFAVPDAGRVFCNDEDVTMVPPQRRRMGFVFQSYALFPTKSVAENIAFPLAVTGRPRAERNRRVQELAELMEIASLLGRYPHELSGGQQQRVALARALAAEPEALLLDEPMSALDARIRARLRHELRTLVDRLGITTLYVTHDQEEALSLSDRVVVMRRGRVEQVGTPPEIYHRPRSRFVAEFVGTSNLIEGLLTPDGLQTPQELWPLIPPPDAEPGQRRTMLFRPEHLGVSATDTGGLAGRVRATTFLGAALRLEVTLDSGRTVVCDVSSDDAVGTWARGMRVSLCPDVRHAALLPLEPA